MDVLYCVQSLHINKLRWRTLPGNVAFSLLQGKRLRWLGHVFRMPDNRLPKKLLFGQVKGLRPPGRLRSSFNDVALRDCQKCQIGRPYRDAQDRLLWSDKTCPART